ALLGRFDALVTCLLRALRHNLGKTWNRKFIDHGKQQIAAQPVSARFQAKNHFELRRVDGAENSQARFRAVHTDPFFAAVADFVEEILDKLFGDSQTPAGNAQLNPIRWLYADERREVLEQRAARPGNLEGGVGVAGEQRLVQEKL